MSTNKSIDGLTIRNAAKNPAPRSSKKKPTPKTKIKVVSDETETISKKPASTSKKQEAFPTPTPEPTKPSETREQKVEDFLKPVQAFDFDEQTGELKASKVVKKDKKQSKKSKKPEKKKPSKARRIITAILLVIVLALIGLITWAVFWGNDIIAKITGGQGNVLDLIKFVEPTYEPLKTDANGRTNILALGTSGYNMEGEEGDGIHDGAQLTDSIMMISLNQETGDVVMLSLPRDLKASPTCTATGKINEVYWCNNMYGEDEAAGATALMDEVGSILGVEFQYYAHVNWGSLVSIVDILDGITITLDEPVYDYAWYEANFPYKINGEEAIRLARTRYGTPNGDFSRGANQQKILIGIKDRVLEKNLSITDFIDIASTLGDNLRTNFSIDEMKTLAHLTFDFDFNNMRQLTLLDPANDIYYMTTGTLDNGISYVFPRAGVGNYAAIQEYVATNLSNDPRVYEDPSIIVLNATDEAGLASTEQNKLTEAGYSVAAIDNAPEGTKFKDNYTIYINGDKPGTKKMLESFYNTKTKSIDEAPESITRDYNFVIILGPTPEKTSDN